MSKGSGIVPVRLTVELLAQIDVIVEDAHGRRRAEPWTRSSFIRHCVRMELSRRERSRTSHRKKK